MSGAASSRPRARADGALELLPPDLTRDDTAKQRLLEGETRDQVLRSGGEPKRPDGDCEPETEPQPTPRKGVGLRRIRLRAHRPHHAGGERRRRHDRRLLFAINEEDTPVYLVGLIPLGVGLVLSYSAFVMASNGGDDLPGGEQVRPKR